MNFARKPLQPGQRIFRPFVLVTVVLMTVYGFWINNQKRLDSLIVQGLFTDKAGLVDAHNKEILLDLLKKFKPSFGIPLEVSILTSPPSLEKHDPTRIYLDILPRQRRAMLTLPPLVRRAADPDFAAAIENLFHEAFASGDWRSALLPSVLAIRETLTELNR